MKITSKHLLLVFALVLAIGTLAACRRPPPPPVIAQEDFVAADLGPVISVDQLRALIDSGDPNLVIIGAVNPVAALVPFSAASRPIEGSYLIWRPDISRSNSDAAIDPLVSGMRLSREEMETLLSRAGVTANSRIVVFAAGDLMDIGRIIWHLEMLGLQNVHYLDGGINAWIAAGQPTGSGTRLTGLPERTNFSAPNYDATGLDAPFSLVVEALQNPDEWVVIDTRSPAENAGERVGASGGAFGTGRIAGAVHINWTSAINPDTNLLRSIEELQAIYGDVIRGRNVITFCQGGVRSAHTWFVLRHVLNHDRQVLNWDGSWIEWSFAASSASGGRFPGILEMTEAWTDNNGPI